MSDVVVRLRGDIRDLQTNLAKASASIKTFASTALTPVRALEAGLKKAFSLKGLIIGGSASLAVKQLVSIGSAAEEAENLFDVSFGNMASSVREWSKQLGEQLKVSDTGLRQTAGSFKLFLDGFDLAPDKAAEMSKALTKMAYDMSSLRNLRFEDSLTKIQAALAGEVEPLRRIGVTVNDTTLRLWALKNGLDANVKGWTEQQKVVGRFAVVQEGLEKDQGDLEKTMGSTTNLLRSIGDQIKELTISIYAEWKPTIQATLTTVRDWLVQNRDTIAKWAGKVGAYFTYVKDVFAGFVQTLQKSPKEGFQVLMKSLIEVMKAAAEIAVDLAVRIGKGIWEGVREGVLGGIDETAVTQRAMEIYKAGGGQTYTEKTVTGVGFGGGKTYNTIEQPNSISMYNRAMDQARLEAQQRRAKEISDRYVAGFGENAMASFQRAGERGLSVSPTFAAAADTAAQNLKQRLAEIDAKFRDSDTTTGEWTETVRSAGAAVDDLRGKLAAMHKEAGGGSGFLAGLQDLRKELPSLAEHLYDIGKAVRDGITNSLADAVFEAKNLKDAMSEMVKGVARMMFEYQMQRAIVGMSGSFPFGFGGGSPRITAATPGAGGVHGFSRGGLVYAASGMFIPKGTDTVPAMLTPGESVLDRDTTAGLRRVFGGSGSVSSAPAAPVINITNQTNTPVSADQTESRFDGTRYVTSILLKDKRNHGQISRSMHRR